MQDKTSSIYLQHLLPTTSLMTSQELGFFGSASPKITEHEKAPELFGIKITLASQRKIRRALAVLVLFRATLSPLALCLKHNF